jgi:hypothetical protein
VSEHAKYRFSLSRSWGVAFDERSYSRLVVQRAQISCVSITKEGIRFSGCHRTRQRNSRAECCWRSPTITFDSHLPRVGRYWRLALGREDIVNPLGRGRHLSEIDEFEVGYAGLVLVQLAELLVPLC